MVFKKMFSEKKYISRWKDNQLFLKQIFFLLFLFYFKTFIFSFKYKIKFQEKIWSFKK